MTHQWQPSVEKRGGFTNGTKRSPRSDAFNLVHNSMKAKIGIYPLPLKPPGSSRRLVFPNKAVLVDWNCALYIFYRNVGEMGMGGLSWI